MALVNFGLGNGGNGSKRAFDLSETA